MLVMKETLYIKSIGGEGIIINEQLPVANVNVNVDIYQGNLVQYCDVGVWRRLRLRGG